jgi:glycosyltransferase involved in cell wall biosynthesis
MTATYIEGDAIGNLIQTQRRILTKLGFTVKIFADHYEPHLKSYCQHSSYYRPTTDDILWYHYSLASPNLRVIQRARVFKIMDFHGVSPAEYNPGIEELCHRGEIMLGRLINDFDLCIVHSGYSASLLREKGYQQIIKIPLVVDTSRFISKKVRSPSFAISDNHLQTTSNEEIIEDWELSSYLNQLDYLLFVGKITPQKSILEVLETFYHFKRLRNDKAQQITDPEPWTADKIKLFLVGNYLPQDPYYREVLDRVEQLGLEKDALLTGRISNPAQLTSFYKHARFSLYLSKWESFCVPLIESMFFGTPVIAYNTTAIPEVLGDAGILVDKLDPETVAQTICQAWNDEDTYQKLKIRSKERAELFTEKRLEEDLTQVLRMYYNESMGAWRHGSVGVGKYGGIAVEVNKDRSILSPTPPYSHTPTRSRLALIVQRYGLEVNGGSELLCRWVAEHLSKHFDLEVLTTCAIDYNLWTNVYLEGETLVHGVKVRRFPVEAEREYEDFLKQSEKVYQPGASCYDQLEWMKKQGPRATRLIEYLQKHQNQYDLMIFFTYLYYTTYFGIQINPKKSILVSTAHNEPPLFLRIFDPVFRMPWAIIYLTEEEKNLVNRVFHNETIPSEVIGMGLNLPQTIDSSEFRKKYRIEGKFILYMGRIAKSKGCDELFDHFLKYRRESDPSIQLVLMGKLSGTIPEDPGIRYVGFIPDEDKYNAIAGATLVVNPSPFESLSITILEAWGLGKPVLVNSKSDVLKNHCIQSQAGLWYESYQEFTACLDLLLRDENLRDRLGASGKKYVKTRYPEDVIEKKYVDFINRQLSVAHC